MGNVRYGSWRNDYAGAANAERFYADHSGLLGEQHSENVSAVSPHTNEKDWLLRLELVELMNERKIKTGTRELVMMRLLQLKEESEELCPLIENGLKLL